MSFEFTVDIAAPPERVFAYLTEPELVKRWQPDLAELAPLPPGGLRVGTRQRATVEEYGRRFEVETVVVALIVNQLLGYEMQAPTATVRGEYRLIRQVNLTRIEETVTVKPRGPMSMVWPLVKGFFRRKMESRLKLLKQTVETGEKLSVQAGAAQPH
ncbi:MAG TPA: SRPBCC family protein [Candidatus Angelobacter sp.]